jgi:hypothetical protein
MSAIAGGTVKILSLPQFQATDAAFLHESETGSMTELTLTRHHRAYINVMESLVAQEVGRQLQDLPARTRRYLKIEEVVTYALNRLPAMYASSEKGWQYQRQLAKKDLHRKIQTAVRQAIVAVQVDPLRLSQPLPIRHSPEAEAVLQALRSLFQMPDLDWPTALEQLGAFKQNPLATEPIAAQNAPAWRPGPHGRQVAWTHRRPRPAQDPEDSASKENQDLRPIGWDNVLYRL